MTECCKKLDHPVALGLHRSFESCCLLAGVDVLPLFRLLYAQVAASCSALATALQLRKGLKHVRILQRAASRFPGQSWLSNEWLMLCSAWALAAACRCTYEWLHRKTRVGSLAAQSAGAT